MKTIRMILSALILASLLVGNPSNASAQTTLLCYVKADAIGTNTGNSWDNAYTDLQSALGTSPCTEIWVAAGIFTPGTGRADTFALKNGVAVYGGFDGTEALFTERDVTANIVILSGEIGLSVRTDNSYHVVSGGGADNTAILDGFTIEKGFADDFYNLPGHGGGMFNINSNPSLANLMFTGNEADNYGGGMYNEGSSPNLINVMFYGNAADYGGGMYNNNSDPDLINVAFHLNKANAAGGGGMLNKNSDPTLMNVTFSGNRCKCNSTEPDYLCDSNIGGGILNDDSNPSLTNVTFYANWGIAGGAMFNSNSSPTLTNVTFSENWNQGNFNQSDSGAMYNSASSVIIKDTIIWGDTIYSNPQTTLVIEDSLIKGGCPIGATCSGNIIDADPYLGPLTNNSGYTQTMALGTVSPAIDAASNATCAATDQRGTTRPQGVACDMGAYEVDVPPSVKGIVRTDANPTSKNTIRFNVAFSEPVQNVDGSDFTLTTTGNMGDSSITEVNGTGAIYTVSVATASGNGTIRLDVKNGVDIQDLTNNYLIGNFTSGEIYTVNKRLALRSQSVYDGYIWESTETSGLGYNLKNAESAFRLGDDNQDRQYRAILSFNTTSLPDHAVVTKITLRIRQADIPTGTNPFTTHGGLKVDVRKTHFGTTLSLIASDFQAASNASGVGTFGATPVDNWYTAILGSAAYPYIHLSGTTQFRLRFQVDDNDNMSADYMKFYSGDYVTASLRPTLIIEYHVPKRMY